MGDEAAVAGPAVRPLARAGREAAGGRAFLTERYCLYTVDDEGRVLRGDIDHPPWPLQPATAELRRNTMGEQIGVELSGEPLLHFAALQDVVFWPLRPADEPKPG